MTSAEAKPADSRALAERRALIAALCAVTLHALLTVVFIDSYFWVYSVMVPAMLMSELGFPVDWLLGNGDTKGLILIGLFPALPLWFGIYWLIALFAFGAGRAPTDEERPE